MILKFKLYCVALLFTITMGFAWANSSICSPDKKSLWAVGEFIMDTKSYSLIMQSCDNGRSFNKILPTISNTDFEHISCNQNGCLALGNQYDEKSYSFWPTIGLTSATVPDLQIQKMNPSRKDSLYNLINCNDVHCLAMGVHEKWIPRIAVSNDFGVNWHYVTKIDGKPMFPGEKANVYELSCQDQSCMALGINDHKPFIIVSRDDGESWSFKNMKSAPEKVNYQHISCISERCIIVGSRRLLDQNNGDNSKAFIGYSDDWGDSWHYPDIELADDVLIASFSNVACQQQHCVAVGNHFRKNYAFDIPLVATSDDLGQTWTIVEKFLDLSQMKNYPNAKFYYIDCYQQRCMAAGVYGGEDKQKPFVALSEDAGKHWILPNAVFSELPKSWNMTDIRGIKCGETYCLAWGNINSQELFTLYYDAEKHSWLYKNIMPEIDIPNHFYAYINAISDID